MFDLLGAMFAPPKPREVFVRRATRHNLPCFEVSNVKGEPLYYCFGTTEEDREQSLKNELAKWDPNSTVTRLAEQEKVKA